MHLAFFGSSLVSAYWNGAATYYRGLLKNLAARGHQVTFYEPDAFERQAHRDMADPNWARVVVYPNDEAAARGCVKEARGADVLIKCSGVGVFDVLLEEIVPAAAKGAGKRSVFWDVDAPATLERCADDPTDPFHALVPGYDLVLTYGGGQRVIDGYDQLGARRCVPIYNALDPDTHFPVPPEQRFESKLNLLANRLPDREARIRTFFFDAAEALPGEAFLIGGSGWTPDVLPANVGAVGHVGTEDHNAFNCSPRAVLNVSRQSMARFGFSPATRVFEAAGAGACLITDDWVGIDAFLEPGEEVLVARDGPEVARHLLELSPQRARKVGAAARRRVLADHTYSQRAELVEEVLK